MCDSWTAEIMTLQSKRSNFYYSFTVTLWINQFCYYFFVVKVNYTLNARIRSWKTNYWIVLKTLTPSLITFRYNVMYLAAFLVLGTMKSLQNWVLLWSDGFKSLTSNILKKLKLIKNKINSFSSLKFNLL